VPRVERGCDEFTPEPGRAAQQDTSGAGATAGRPGHTVTARHVRFRA